MNLPVERGGASASSCPLCESSGQSFGIGVVRGKYEARFSRCVICGFVWVEDPVWLEEAYRRPINVEDTGYVARNIRCRDYVAAFMRMYLRPAALCLDYGAGFGLFVRLMRDEGFEFLWKDAHTENLFASGFECKEGVRYDLVTAFEVFEHIVDPRKALSELLQYGDVILCSTQLISIPPPDISSWWYYGLSHGQHVSFYSLPSFRRLAADFGLNFYTDGSAFHIFSRRSFAEDCLLKIKSPLRRWMAAKTCERESLVGADYEALSRR